MSSRREEMLGKLLRANPSETEQKMIKLAIERICVDMAEYLDRKSTRLNSSHRT